MTYVSGVVKADVACTDENCGDLIINTTLDRSLSIYGDRCTVKYSAVEDKLYKMLDVHGVIRYNIVIDIKSRDILSVVKYKFREWIRLITGNTVVSVPSIIINLRDDYGESYNIVEF